MAYQQAFVQPAMAPHGNMVSPQPIQLFSGFRFHAVQYAIQNALHLQIFNLNACRESQEMFEDIKHKSDMAIRQYVQSLYPGWTGPVNLKGFRGHFRHVVKVHFSKSPFRLQGLEYVETRHLDGKLVVPVPGGIVVNGLTVYDNGAFQGANAPSGNGHALPAPLAPAFSSPPDGNDFLAFSSSAANAASLPGSPPSGAPKTPRSASVPPVVGPPFSSSPPGNPSPSHSTPTRRPPPFPQSESRKARSQLLMRRPSTPELLKDGAEFVEWKRKRDAGELAAPLKEEGKGWSLGPLTVTSTPGEKIKCRWPLAGIPAIGFEIWCQ